MILKNLSFRLIQMILMILKIQKNPMFLKIQKIQMNLSFRLIQMIQMNLKIQKNQMFPMIH